MFTKSQIFTAAWTVAREGAAKFGGKSRQFFADALRQAYQFIKSAAITAAPRALSVFEKLDALANAVFVQRRFAAGSFARRFVEDNAKRYMQYGDKTRFSDKQIDIINSLYADYI